MAISHALAQSTKLLLYEQRLGDLVNRTKDMPAYLAKTGKVWFANILYDPCARAGHLHGINFAVSLEQVTQTRKQIAQLIGTVFIHKSNVNLLSSVLDTPEYFWCGANLCCQNQVCVSQLNPSDAKVRMHGATE